MSRRDDVERWVNTEFSHFETRMIVDMIEHSVGEFHDITPYEDDSEIPVDYCYGLPMWGTMFQFKRGLDDEWLEDHVEDAYKCGFHIWDSDYGMFLGIDGAGYDFYESHWIPLYEARWS